MPQKSENLRPNWNDIDDEGQHIPLKCPWTITSGKETLIVVITCLKWSFNYDSWIRVTAHPEGNPNISKQLDINKHNPLLESLSEALDEYEDFPEPHLDSYQLHILGELLDSLPWENKMPTMANTHLAYPDLAIDKFSGTDPDQDAEFFIQLIERKINFALGDAPADAGELVNYTFRKKALFFPYSEDQPLSGTKGILPTQQPGGMFEQISSLDFQMDETSSDTEWKWNTSSEEMEKKSEISSIASRELWIKGGQAIWKELPQQIMVLKEQLKDDKEDKDTLTTH